MSEAERERPATPEAAYRELLAGNRRFVAGERVHTDTDAAHRRRLAVAQFPFAVVLGCSDSRLGAEIIFDRGLGDLFVVRTAGPVLGPEVLGTIEFAVDNLATPLIVVLGHDTCGAVGAALDALNGGELPGGYLRDVVERVLLSVHQVKERALIDPEEGVREHLRRTTEQLVGRSPVIAERVADGRCAVVGLFYRLAEGDVAQITAVGL